MSRFYFWVFSLSLLFFILLAPAQAYLRIKAQKIIYLPSKGLLLAQGKVRLIGHGLYISCPCLRYNLSQARIVLWGPLRVVSSGGDYLEASRGWLNLKKKEGEVEDAHLYLNKKKVHVIAAQIKRQSEGSYVAHQALITTCEVCPRCSPSWSFQAKRLVITPTGQGKAYHVTFRVHKWPLFYSPYFALALKRSRKTGFLFPRLTHGSREGLGIELPFFWAVNDSFDLTFFPYYTKKKGLMSGLEVRYALGKDSKGVFRFRYLRDRVADDDYHNDGLVRNNQNRYWFTAKIDQSLATEWILRLDADILSDQDFLYEFQGGKLGFEESHKSYLYFFGRGLDEENSRYRTNRLWLTHRKDSLFLQTSFTYYASVYTQEQNKLFMPLSRTDFAWLLSPLWGPFSGALSLRHTYWWRKEGYRGQRLELKPEISLSPHLFPYDLELIYRERAVFYRLDWREEKGKETLFHRGYELEAKTGLSWFRVYPFSHGGFLSLRHSIRPQFQYIYRYPFNQKDQPLFSEADNLPYQNLIRYGLIQYFTAKKKGPSGPEYFDLARIWIYQKYDFSVSKQHFSNVFLDMDLSLPQRLYLRNQAIYNLYGQGLVSWNVTSSFHYGQGEFWQLGYRWDKENHIRQLSMGLRKHVYGNFFTSLNLKKSLVSGETISSQWSLSYEAQCWKANFLLSSNPYETRYALFINLLGVGGYGREFGP